MLEWIAISFSRGSFRPRNQTGSPTLQADALLSEPPAKPNTHREIIKAPLLHQNFGPRVFLSLSLSLSLSLFPQLIPWSAETRQAHSPAGASKTLLTRCPVPSPHLERVKSCIKDLIGLLCKPGSISLLLSFTFLSSPPDLQVLVH